MHMGKRDFEFDFVLDDKSKEKEKNTHKITED